MYQITLHFLASSHVPGKIFVSSQQQSVKQDASTYQLQPYILLSLWSITTSCVFANLLWFTFVPTTVKRPTWGL